MAHILAENPGRDHTLKEVDARLKVLVAGGILLLILSSKGFVFPLVVAAMGLALSLRMRIPWKILFMRFSEPIFITVVLIAIKVFLTGGRPVFALHLFGFTLSACQEGLLEGLLMGARIIGAVSVVSILSFVTPFTDMMSALQWLKFPKGLVDILMFAYRYIFVLSEDALVIYSAQKNRLGYSNMRRGFSSFGMLAGSLTIKALEHSRITASAMAQRGYDGTIPVFGRKHLRIGEVTASILVIAAAVLLWTI